MNLNAFNLGVPGIWLPPKIILIMKLIVIIMTGLLMQVSAAGLAQKLTYVQKNAALSQVFFEIRNQTGYDVLWPAPELDVTQKINANFKAAGLSEVMEQCLQKGNFSFSIEDQTIVIKEKMPSFLEGLAERWAAIDIRGRVVDEKGDPLPGATVTVKATGKFVVTNDKGEFYLKGVEEGLVLVLSYIGYTNREVPAIKDLGEIRMVMASADLQEVEINKGYYTEKRRLSTGSVDRVTAAEIEKQPVSNLLQALQGRMAGVNITQSSGIPGANFKVEIRGQNSLRSDGNYPLYIINSVPISANTLTSAAGNSVYPGSQGASPLNGINPSDIIAVEILKDADATAIYGSRGANGVVLITTKTSMPGKMSADVNIYSGVGEVTRKMKLLNTDEYIMMRKEAFKNDGITTYPVTAYDLNLWDQKRYTDWQEELIGGTGHTYDAQLNLSGGTEQSLYRFGGGYHRDTPVFPGNFSDQRLSGFFNLSSKALKRFKSEITINYSISTSKLSKEDFTSKALTLSPNSPALFDEAGNINFENETFAENPISTTRKPYSANTKYLIGNASLEYMIFKKLFLKLNSGYTNATMRDVVMTPLSSYPASYSAFLTNESTFGSTQTNSWIIEPQINWGTELGKGNLNFLLGSTFQQEDRESLLQNAKGFASEYLMENISAVPAANIISNFSNSRYRYNSIFGRLNYELNSKYILNVTGRRDASSRFGPDKVLADFWAIGAAWNFANEGFVRKYLPFITSGKLRSSYGLTGSDQIGNYQYLDIYSTVSGGQYQGISGLNPKQLFNPNYSWETNKKFESAVELSFLNDRIMFTGAYYINRSSNQLVGYRLPWTTGFSSVQSNLNATVENRGIEISVNAINIKSKNFRWSTSLNLTFPKNKLVNYPNLAGTSYSTTYVVGQPLSILFVYDQKGVNPQNGIYDVVDIDGNGLLNQLDKTSYLFLGPKCYGGFQNILNYKSFQLDALLQFVKQDGRNYLGEFTTPGTGFNQPTEVLSRWQNLGDDKPIQKFSSGVVAINSQAFSNYRESTALVSDASFIRLKNVSLSYRFNEEMNKRLGVQHSKVFIQGQNLVTITKYKGLDPESQGMRLPPLRWLTMGVQLTF
jgi:TonB-linked SusC/RagA family outer membrane protein